MNNISAAIGIEQLDRFDKILADTQKIGKIYNKELSIQRIFICAILVAHPLIGYIVFSK